MTIHRNPELSGSEAPTPKQLRELRGIANATGTNYAVPTTRAEAEREIARLHSDLDDGREGGAPPFRLVMTYPLPDGGRHIVLVTLPGSPDARIVLDVPVDDDDASDTRLVGAGYPSEGTAWSAGIRYAIESQRLGRPAANLGRAA